MPVTLPALKQEYMKIQICVFLNADAQSTGARVFERLIDWDSNLVFPMSKFIDVLSVCFGSKCIIHFDVRL